MALSLALISAGGSLQAQSTRGTVTGIITDPSGAVVSNAEVTLVNPATGVELKLHTNSAGVYRFDGVLVGDYKVIASASGFQKSETEATVTVGATVGRNFALKIGSATTVEVRDEIPNLQNSDAVRSSVVSYKDIDSMPISGGDTLNLMLLVPGAVATKTGSGQDNGIGSINGAGGRSNNFMIDGINNNDISVTGPQYSMTNPDLLQEVSVQASNFSSDFGHAGGAIVSQVTKSGTNELHGTGSWIYHSQIFDASNQYQRYVWNNYSASKRATTPVVPKYMDSMPGFTIGGPVVIPGIYDGHNKTFFFGGAQWDHDSIGANTTTFDYVPTANGYATLAALSAKCKNVATYLNQLGTARSTASSPSSISIEAPGLSSTTCDGTDRSGQSVEVGSYSRQMPDLILDNNHLVRVDHVISDRQNLMLRWLWNSKSEPNSNVGINSNYDVPYTQAYWAGNVNHNLIISPNLFNEFRFGFSRNILTWFTTNAQALSNPYYSIANLSSLTLSSTYPQGRVANTWQWSDTMTWNRGRHAIKFGTDLSLQLATQQAPINNRGTLTYVASVANSYVSSPITGMANFIDDVGGPNGTYAKVFATGRYHPNVFIMAFYATDTYKVTNNLTINYGVRYENYGQPANIFKYPAYSGLYGNADDVVKAHQSNFNFSPSIGFSWNPGLWNHTLVVRGGYSLTYDTFYNNLLSNMAAAAPNGLTNNSITSISSSATPRGYVGLSGLLTTGTAVAINPYTAIANVFNKDIRNPYYNHISLGVQKELPGKAVLDVAYVGTLGRQLFYTNYANPIQPNAAQTTYATQSTSYGTQYVRLNSARGSIISRESGLTSNYNSLQVSLARKPFKTYVGQFAMNGNYNWSKMMDIVSDTFSSYSSPLYISKSINQWGAAKKYDYSPSDLDRRHVANAIVQWNIRGAQAHKQLDRVVGGWSLTPVVTFMTGSPYTVYNGYDRDLDGTSTPDRPNIGNKNAPLNTRAVPTTKCTTGYYNPNVSSTPANACVSATDVHWVEVASYQPTSNSMEGRNSNYMGYYINMNMNVAKDIKINERFKAQLRSEFYNVTNTQSYDVAKFAKTVSSTSNTFYDASSFSGGSRSFRVTAKVIF